MLYVLPAGLAAAFPGIHGVLLYERGKILHGELWRLWTSHWTHFSYSHLLWNLVVLLLAGPLLERARPGLLRRYTLSAAPLISISLLALAPDMQTFGGLSGLATGLVTLVALARLADEPQARTGWVMVLGLVAAKILMDTGRATPLFADFAASVIRPSRWAHALGIGSALLVFALAAKSRPDTGAANKPLASHPPARDAYKFSGPTP
jgi:rhomboid family GlyGly-CTERM serine protease